MLPTVLDVYAARERLRPHLPPTPLRYSPWLSDAAGGDVFLKLESLNQTNAFKIRGAMNAVLQQAERSPNARPTLVTASAGNHGWALAVAAGRLDWPCVVFTPENAPETKTAAIRRHGAVLRLDGRDYDAAERLARAFARDEGGVFISAYNHPAVIAGAGTIGLEIADALPELNVVVIPLGGGGLTSGVGLAMKAAAPRAALIAVEVEASSPFTLSLRAGRIVEITPQPSLADGLTGNLEPDSITFALVRQVADQIVTIGEHDIVRAMRGLAAEEHLVVEASGSVGVAAILSGKVAAGPGRKVVAIVTGGNVDLDRFLTVVGANASNG
jgi:threonine dehydratase